MKSLGNNSKNVFDFFEKISAIPRGSGNEKAISDFIADFGRQRGLEVIQDKAHNVIVKKPASKGYEEKQPVILQSHIDMVCVKRADSNHDFLNDPIKVISDGDFIYADGTSLGADDGIGVSYMLALLDSDDIPHPKLECLFTADEEVGMGGAKLLDMSVLEGRRLINIDSEEEGVFCVSCAGGVRVDIALELEWEKEIPFGFAGYNLKIRGLKGGHSGSDIHLQLASAINLMGRVLARISENTDLRIACLSGGSADNAIAAFSEAEIFLPKGFRLEEILKNLEKEFNNEYKSAGESIYLIMEEACPKRAFTKDFSEKIIKTLILSPYGVSTINLDMAGFTESSCNPGVMYVDGENFHLKLLVRSSSEVRKRVIVQRIRAIAELAGGRVSETGDYPPWEYNSDSALMKYVPALYEKMFGKKAEIETTHAGLECGVFSGKIPDMDIISFGPDLFRVHSIDEHLSISSAERMWDFLKEILKNMD